jgi:hypothetical protein
MIQVVTGFRRDDMTDDQTGGWKVAALAWNASILSA